MRVLLISLFVTVITLIALSGARIWGLTLPYQRFPLAFTEGPKPAFFVRVSSLEEGRKILKLKSNAGLWVDVRETADGKLPIITDEELEKNLTAKAFPPEQWRGPFPFHYTETELRTAFPQAAFLADFLNEFPKTKFIINIADNVAAIDLGTIEAVENAKAGDRVLIQSDTESLMKQIKEKKPLWAFGTSRGDIMRLNSFESIYLEPASPFLGDVFISPVTMHGRDILNHTVVQEIHRRQKDVELGPLTSRSEYDAARHEGAEGFILSTPSLAEIVFANP